MADIIDNSWTARVFPLEAGAVSGFSKRFTGRNEGDAFVAKHFLAANKSGGALFVGDKGGGPGPGSRESLLEDEPPPGLPFFEEVVYIPEIQFEVLTALIDLCGFHGVCKDSEVLPKMRREAKQMLREIHRSFPIGLRVINEVGIVAVFLENISARDFDTVFDRVWTFNGRYFPRQLSRPPWQTHCSKQGCFGIGPG